MIEVQQNAKTEWSLLFLDKFFFWLLTNKLLPQNVAKQTLVKSRTAKLAKWCKTILNSSKIVPLILMTNTIQRKDRRIIINTMLTFSF